MSNYDSYKTRSDYDEYARWGREVEILCEHCGAKADFQWNDMWLCEACCIELENKDND